MPFDSSNDTVAILYDIENAPFEMLDYTLGKARRFQPCRIIVVTDWDKVPDDQKRWERLRRRPGFTFRPVTRTYLGKNSLDNALYDSAQLLYQDGVRRYFIITTDSDFVKIAEALNSGEKSYIIGVGTKQASETLRNAYDEFLCYPPEKPEKKPRKAKEKKEKKESDAKASKKTEKAKSEPSKNAGKKKEPKDAAEKSTATKKGTHSPKVEAQKAAEPKLAEVPKKGEAQKKDSVQGEKSGKNLPVVPMKHGTADSLTVRLPRTLQRDLERRREEEGVSMDELVTYLLMRGITQ